MKTSGTLPRNPVALFAPPPLQPPVIHLGLFGHLWLPAEAGENDLIGGGEVVQDLELLEREPARDHQDAQRDQQDDDDRESNGR